MQKYTRWASYSSFSFPLLYLYLTQSCLQQDCYVLRFKDTIIYFHPFPILFISVLLLHDKAA